MRLTSFSDYSLRILLYAAGHAEARVTIEAASDYFRISRAHVKKVVMTLTHAGFLKGFRGRSGGFELALPPEEINLGKVLRVTEPDFALFECFQPGNECCISRRCGLPSVANEALRAFLAVFDRYSLADFQLRPELFLTPAEHGAQPLRGPILQAG